MALSKAFDCLPHDLLIADNTISAISDTVLDLVNSLTDKANKAVDWSHVNKMIARTQSHFTHKK